MRALLGARDPSSPLLMLQAMPEDTVRLLIQPLLASLLSDLDEDRQQLSRVRHFLCELLSAPAMSSHMPAYRICKARRSRLAIAQSQGSVVLQAQETRIKWLIYVLMDALSSVGPRLPELKSQLTSALRKGFKSQSKVHNPAASHV